MADPVFPPVNLIRKALTGMQAHTGDFAAYRQPLQPGERNSEKKPPAGGDFITSLVLARTREQGIETQSMPLAKLEALRDHAKELRPLAEMATGFALLLSDMVHRAESGAWRGTRLYYGMLNHNAQTDAGLREKMAPINEFFARRSRPVREEQAVARAERNAARAAKKAAKAQRVAAAIKARRDDAEGEFVVVPARAEPNGAGQNAQNGVA